MTITITPEIKAAFEAYLNEPVDFYSNGPAILRRNTYPYNQEFCTGIISFAAGYQARSAVADAKTEADVFFLQEEFGEGQWWTKELDVMASATTATHEQKRAVAVVRNLLRQLRNRTQTSSSERVIRRMLCANVAGSKAYMDDGEASDSSMLPHIDFLRDNPEEIQKKLAQRATKKLHAAFNPDGMFDPTNFRTEGVFTKIGGFSQIDSSGVRMVHIPTGLTVESTTERSQHRNRDIAWNKMVVALVNLKHEKENENGKS